MQTEFILKFADEAERWTNMKVPFKHMGTTEKGCDCTGFIIGVLQKLGKFRDYKLRKYKYDWNVHAGACDIITEELLKVGDFTTSRERGNILIFRFRNCNAHTGIIMGDSKFAHNMAAGRHCKFDLIKKSIWFKRLTGVIRLNEEKIAKYS